MLWSIEHRCMDSRCRACPHFSLPVGALTTSRVNRFISMNDLGKHEVTMLSINVLGDWVEVFLCFPLIAGQSHNQNWLQAALF